MEFENVDSDFTINNLSRALPDIVIQNYEFRGDLSVGYLDKVDPYFPKESNNTAKQSGLIINGRFSSSKEEVDIEVELYDLSTWDMLGKKTFYCPIDNMTCIHDAFLIIVDELLEDYIIAEEERKIAPGEHVTKRIIYSKDQLVDNSDIFKEALNVDSGWFYSRDFYETTLSQPHPKECAERMDFVERRLGSVAAVRGYGYTHDCHAIDQGPALCAYKTLDTMIDKMNGQLELGHRLRAVDVRRVAGFGP